MQPIDYEHLLKEATVHFSRSSGKGGQNVNKVETRVELVFNINESKVLDDATKAILMDVLKNKIDHEGHIRITASSERLQHANRRKAEEKFVRLIADALKPKKKRFKTAPTFSSKIARLYSKHKHKAKKHERKKSFSFDE